MRVSRARRRKSGLVFIVLLSASFLPGLRASGSDVAETLIRKRQAELEQLKTQVETRRIRIAELRKEGENLEKVLVELERQRALTGRYIRTLDAQVGAMELDLAARRGQLERKELELKATRGELGQTLTQYYKRGRVRAAELLVSSATFGEIFARSHYWIRAIRKLRAKVQLAADQSQDIRSDVKAIESRRRDVLDLRAERKIQLAALQGEENARRRDREELERMVALYEEQTRKLLASQGRIEQLIVEAQRRAGGVAGLGLTDLRGHLPWPVKGRIITRFGTHVHPRYGTRVRQKGIEIAAPEGTPVKAVSGGWVVYEGWLEGYGKTVILNHGEGYFTLYAHASEVVVARGEEVGAGQVVARVGSTDALKGPALHFEIRQGSEALDPARWLRRGK